MDDYISAKSCILCARDIVKSNERYLVEGKGKFDVIKELKSLPFLCERDGEYICKTCLQALKKRRGYLENIRKIEQDLKESKASVPKRRSSEEAIHSTPTKLPRSDQATIDCCSTPQALKPTPFPTCRACVP